MIQFFGNVLSDPCLTVAGKVFRILNQGASKDNEVKICQKSLGAALNTSPPVISNAFSTLMKAGFIEKLTRGHYRINPEYSMVDKLSRQPELIKKFKKGKVDKMAKNRSDYIMLDREDFNKFQVRIDKQLERLIKEMGQLIQNPDPGERKEAFLKLVNGGLSDNPDPIIEPDPPKRKRGRPRKNPN